jgi:hypothetical protein
MMSSITKYYCDQCKEETESEKMQRIELKLEPNSPYHTKKFTTTYKYYTICEKCAERLGFIKIVEDVNKIKIAEPTTAERLYDVIVQMIQESTH